MRWSKDHILRTTALKEGEIGDKLKNWEREMCKQKLPSESSEPAGVQPLTKPGGDPREHPERLQAGILPLEAPRHTAANLHCGADPRPPRYRDIQTTAGPWREGASGNKTTSELYIILLRDRLLLRVPTMPQPNASSRGDWWAHFVLILSGVGKLLVSSCQEENDGRHFQ